MATQKQPRFPHPPLETGVAQYPTPLVPNYYDKRGGWSINDQGHIILVEKVSIEKGSFNPQPLDGSVTYTGRDANKWPSSLYLVAEKPTPDGEFIYRYWANDRSLSSQDIWNYGIEYSSNNPSYPVTSRTYIVPRSQYATVALGSTDPVFGGTQIISQQKMIELSEDNPLYSRYVAVQRVYESIPGPVLTGKKLDERGDIETITTQTVPAGTSPDADGLLVTQTAVQPVDSVKSTKTKGTVSSYATLTSKSNKAGLLGDISTTDNIVDPSTSPDSLSTTVLESTVEQLTATKARKRTTTSTGPTQLNGVNLTAEFGPANVKQEVVSYGYSSAPDYQTIKSEVDPIDIAKSKLSEVKYSSLHTLTGYQYDEFFETNLIITKELIDVKTGELTHSNGILSYKDDPVNYYQKQRTIVRTSSLPPKRVEYKTAGYSTPQLVFSLVVEFQILSTSVPPDIRVRITPVTRAAQSRLTMQKITTSFTYGPPDAPDLSKILSPELKRVAYTGFNTNFDLGDALCDPLLSYYDTTSHLLNINAVLLSGYFNGNISTPVYENINIPATSISASTYNTYLNTWRITSFEQEYWKSGIWVSRQVETYII